MSAVERLRGRLDSLGAASFLVTDPINIRYVTGFESTNAAAIVRGDRVLLLTDGRYLAAARGIDGVEAVDAGRDLAVFLGERLAELAEAPVAVEADHLTYAAYGSVASGGVALVPTTRVVKELRAIKTAAELDTWDQIMRAHWHIRRFTRSDFSEARRLIEELLRHEPNNAVALGDLAFSLHFAVIFGWVDSPAAEMTRMGELAQRAVESDDRDAAAHTSLAIHELFMGRHDDALRRLARAIELNPNSSFAHGYVGVVHAFSGGADRALESVQEAMRLSPRDLLMVIWRVVEGWAHLSAARFDRAAESARLAIAWNASFADAHAILASALGHAGRLYEARAALSDTLRHLPGLTLRDPRLRRPFRLEADRERFLDGLRKAGLTEA